MRLRSAAMGMGFALITLSAAGQGASSSGNQTQLANGGLLHSILAAPVVGQPYSAVQVTHTVQTLANGTKVSQSGHHAVARDSVGRVRVEQRIAKGRDGSADVFLVFVMDPSAHTLTTWAMGMKDAPKRASVVKLPAQPRGEEKSANTPASARDESTRPKPVVTIEDLGTESLEGQTVSVSRTTTIVPAGRSGNDAPITKTREVWTSPDLKLVLKEQWEDPRTGVRTVALEKLSRAEPDAALFRPPSGYEVKSVMESLKDLEEKLAATQQP